MLLTRAIHWLPRLQVEADVRKVIPGATVRTEHYGDYIVVNITKYAPNQHGVMFTIGIVDGKPQTEGVIERAVSSMRDNLEDIYRELEEEQMRMNNET